MDAERTQQLVLAYPQLHDRLNVLFEEMEQSRDLRESFVRNPAVIAWEYLFENEPPPTYLRSKLSSANKLLYCLLADPGMREWAVEYAREVRERYSDLEVIQSPMERKREFLRRIDLERVGRDFASALSRVGGLDIQTSVVMNEARLEMERPEYAVIGPIAATPVIVVAFAGLFIVAETEFAVHVHNALWAQNDAEGPDVMDVDGFEDWLGLTRTRLRGIANVLANAMVSAAAEVKAAGALEQSSDDLQAVLDALVLEGPL